MAEQILEPVFRMLRTGKVRKHLRNDMTVCDIGCGDGSFLCAISPYISQGYGFDKKAKERSFDNIVIKKARIDKKVPLDSDTMDCVSMMAVLEHLEDPAKVLQECHRILKPGGRILLTTPSPPAKPILEFLSYRLNIVNPEEIRDHKRYFSKRDLRDVLDQSRFREINVRTFEVGLNNFATGIK